MEFLLKMKKFYLLGRIGGPYDGKLDLPGGTIEFGEKPELALIREFREEVGIDIIKYELIDADSVNVHHIGVFYKIINYHNKIKLI